MELKFQPYEDLDLTSLKKAVEQLNRAYLEGKLCSLEVSKGSTLDPKTILNSVNEHLKIIHEKGRVFGSTEVSLRIEMVLNGLIERLLMCVKDEKAGLSITELPKLLSNKLAILNDDDIMRLWGAVQKEFATDQNTSGFLIDQRAKEFLLVTDVTEVRKKLAEYLLSYRGFLTKKSFLENRAVWLQPILGIAKILTIRNRSELEIVTADEINFLRTLSRVVYLWNKCLRKDKGELIQFLGTMEDGYIFTGDDTALLSSKAKELPRDKEKYLFLQLIKLIKYSTLLVEPISEIEEALWVHKLGLEVTLPESRGKLDDVNEEYLQKHLCKFLIERGIQAFGTKFGRNQIDLLLQKGGEKHIVETKKYKKTKVTGRKIQKDLVQLQAYMSQQFNAPRGVLLIYNFTDTVICSPTKWIKGRYLVLSINLGTKSASESDCSILVEPGVADDLINCSEINIPKINNRKNR